ncbi:MAG: hypothetical protein WED04_11895 [Promethearchaeati archaeon SRVP18_Atabeyarchaeia-1]
MTGFHVGSCKFYYRESGDWIELDEYTLMTRMLIERGVSRYRAVLTETFLSKHRKLGMQRIDIQQGHHIPSKNRSCLGMKEACLFSPSKWESEEELDVKTKAKTGVP